MKNNKIKFKVNYRIFKIDDSDKNSIFPKKLTVIGINAKDDEDAYQQLKKYSENINKNKKHLYYVEPWDPIIINNLNGTSTICDDIFVEMDLNYNSEPLHIKIYTTIDAFFYKYFIYPIENFKYWYRDTVYLLKNKQTYQASWSIDDDLLNVLLHNIPILKKHKHTLSWKMLDKAVIEAHKNEKDFNLKKFYDTHQSGFGKEIEDKAIKFEHDLFDQLIANIKAYQYYSGEYAHIDKKNIELVELDKKLRPTLPLIKGSYDRYDYAKLNKITEKHWNRIWEIVRVYGREFND